MPVYKDKERGTWYYDFKKKVDGITYSRKKRGFQSKTEALLEEQKAIDNLGNEQNIKEDKTFVLDDLAALYFQYQETKLKTTTLELIQRLYNKHISPNLGRILVFKLNNKYLYEWKRNFLKTELTESFYNKVITVFRQIVQFGINKDYIKNTSLLDELEKVHLNQIVPERQVLTLDEIQKFLDTFDKAEPKEYDYWLYFYAYSNTGMRPNEFRALQVKDIQGDYLVVNKSITSKLKGGDVLQTPKTKTSVRKVLMPHEIIVLLKEHTKNYKPNDFIFGKDKAFRETNLNRSLKMHLKAAGVPEIVLYGFRHSHATNLIKAGVPIKVVAQRLGHKNASTTMNVYWHLFQDDEQQVLNVLKAQK